MTQIDSPRLRWPAEEFYWALLDRSLVRRRSRGSDEQLGYLFEPLIPQSLEEIHAVYEPLPDNRILACGASREALAEVPEGVMRLTPSELPLFVTAAIPDLHDSFDINRLNLLRGDFLPPKLRKLRRKWAMLMAFIAIACALIVSVGQARRATMHNVQRNEFNVQTATIYEQVLGPAYRSSALPPALQLEAHVRELRQTRSNATHIEKPPNAGVTLAKVLQRWPSDLFLETESIHVTEDAVHIQGKVGTAADAQAFASYFEGMEGWRLQQPSLRSSSNGVQIAVRLSRESVEAP